MPRASSDDDWQSRAVPADRVDRGDGRTSAAAAGSAASFGPEPVLLGPLLTIAQAAEVLNVPRSWLRDKVTARAVPHLRLGRHVRFTPQQLRRLVVEAEAAATRAVVPLDQVDTRAAGTPTGTRHVRRGGEGAAGRTSA